MRSIKLSAIKPGLILLLILAVAGCKKPTPFFDQINTGSGDANRKAVVKLVGAENDINVYALNALPTLEDFVLIEVARDPNTSADLGKPLTVKLVKNSALITAYNTANASTYIELPLAAYTLASDISSLTFAPGEIIKSVVMHLKKDQMDFSKLYAIGFTITEVGAGASISATKYQALYSIGVKNAYEGSYITSGFVFHPSVPRALDDAKYLSTLGATRCLAPLADLYGSGYYFKFDVSATNTLINWDGTPLAPPSSGFFTADNPGGIAYPGPEFPGTAPFLQATYNNTYNPTTRTFYMHYGYGSGSSAPTGWTRNFYEKWVRQ